eukprot:CAMPEP_0172070280 /NCGR_PEP_ID=MMETSP1043-20130122/13182_1 /TAXON_ID=464988 /ORGANISM="Hemiselmis andersenii, Strain CCMP441" /LENGTH=313 /DNA_ID=CAMNT_0012730639 /DNA_START=269 /DNA_END=1210 /DNA_ORIENTATION=-
MKGDRRLDLVVESISRGSSSGERDSSVWVDSETDTPLASSPNPPQHSPDPFSRTESLPEPATSSSSPFQFRASSPAATEKRGHRRRRRPHFPSISLSVVSWEGGESVADSIQESGTGEDACGQRNNPPRCPPGIRRRRSMGDAETPKLGVSGPGCVLGGGSVFNSRKLQRSSVTFGETTDQQMPGSLDWFMKRRGLGDEDEEEGIIRNFGALSLPDTDGRMSPLGAGSKRRHSQHPTMLSVAATLPSTSQFRQRQGAGGGGGTACRADCAASASTGRGFLFSPPTLVGGGGKWFGAATSEGAGEGATETGGNL